MADCTNCDNCPTTGTICVPRGDSRLIVFTVRENDCQGDFFDISAATEIVFIVADEYGGTVRITKRLSNGGIQISTNDYQFSLTVTSADTGALVRASNYYEARVTTSGGNNVTVSAGVFKSPNTMIRSI